MACGFFIATRYAAGMRVAAIIVAAGRGERAGGSLPKQLQPLGGKPVYQWSVDAFSRHERVEKIVLVVPSGDEDAYAAVANPKVEICAFSGDKWVRVEALAIDDDRIEPKEKMLDAYPQLKNMYSADDPNTQVLYLKDATATFYTFGGEPEVIKF